MVGRVLDRDALFGMCRADVGRERQTKRFGFCAHNCGYSWIFSRYGFRGNDGGSDEGDLLGEPIERGPF